MIFLSDAEGPVGRAVAEQFRAKGIPVVSDEAALESGGAVSALVLTSRRIEPMSVENGPEDAFDRVMEENVRRAFHLVKTVGAKMAQTGGGAVVFVGSIHAEKPNGASFGFSCSMGALKMLHRECALQLGRQGMHSVYIELGPLKGDDAVFDTPLSPIYDGYLRSIPRKEPVAMAELADLIETAIRMSALNGAEIRMDGGFTLKYIDREDA